MQTTFTKGQQTLRMVKADAALFVQTAYLLGFLARNVDDDAERKLATSTAETLRGFTKKYGAKYLDEKGNLKTTEKEKATDDKAPEYG